MRTCTSGPMLYTHAMYLIAPLPIIYTVKCKCTILHILHTMCKMIPTNVYSSQGSCLIFRVFEIVISVATLNYAVSSIYEQITRFVTLTHSKLRSIACNSQNADNAVTMHYVCKHNVGHHRGRL